MGNKISVNVVFTALEFWAKVVLQCYLFYFVREYSFAYMKVYSDDALFDTFSRTMKLTKNRQNCVDKSNIQQKKKNC